MFWERLGIGYLDLDRLDLDEFEEWADVFDDEIRKAKAEQRKREAEGRRG